MFLRLAIATVTPSLTCMCVNIAPWKQSFSGMEFVDAIYAGYGQKPDQGKIQRQGNVYLDKEFPLLSYISKGYNGEAMEEAAASEEDNNE